jgi:hypothetical protein
VAARRFFEALIGERCLPICARTRTEWEGRSENGEFAGSDPPSSASALHSVENGGGGAVRGLGRIVGADGGVKALSRNAKRLGIRVEVLYAAQRHAARLAATLAEKIPEASRGYVTMAVGVGRDKAGVLRTVIATSERSTGGGGLRSGVREFVAKTRIPVASGEGGVHAEVKALQWLKDQGLQPVSIAATKPICVKCVDAIGRSGATRATRWRQAPR